MRKSRTAGSQANFTGNQLEQHIHQVLDRADYLLVERSRFRAAMYLGQPIFTCQFQLGESIYGTELNVDFTIFHPEKWPKCLVIEAKWQQESGSVDEKYPYLVLNLKKAALPCIVVLAGGGCRTAAAQWLKSQTDDHLIHIFSLEEFLRWANRGNI